MNGKVNLSARVVGVTPRGVGRNVRRVLVGQVLSHVTRTVRDADAFWVAEGSAVGCAIASALLVPCDLRPWHAGGTCFGGHADASGGDRCSGQRDRLAVFGMTGVTQ
jgi:hypothetical protein